MQDSFFFLPVSSLLDKPHASKERLQCSSIIVGLLFQEVWGKWFLSSPAAVDQ
jgi:hypothetical protein